ncbi:hypothetical protein ABW21_db0204843 [Orbilia brochopaga]|nr:hypothetical protein ABW21_db0204843 [Drechslerella brochopaga]
MASIEKLKSPFVPVRITHPVLYSRFINYLDDLFEISFDEKLALESVISHTTNESFFKIVCQMKRLQLCELVELAQFCLVALKNLRNYGGRPALTLETPALSPFGSPPSNATDNQIRAESATKPPARLSSPLFQIGTKLCVIFNIKEPVPLILDNQPARQRELSDSCKLRQQLRCAVSGLELYDGDETTHLFPFSALRNLRGVSKITWIFMSLFLGEELRNELVKELTSETSGIHTAKNGIRVDGYIQTRYNRGLLSLVPLNRPKNDIQHMDVRFSCYSTKDYITMMQTLIPKDPADQLIFGDEGAEVRRILPQTRPLRDGDVLRFFTPDPAQLPLPSSLLLFWHQHLWKTLGGCGLSGSRARYEGRPRSPMKRRASEDPFRPGSSRGNKSVTFTDGAYDWDDEREAWPDCQSDGQMSDDGLEYMMERARRTIANAEYLQKAGAVAYKQLKRDSDGGA